MDIITKNGGQFRTKLMPEGAALRFAKCLRANARFTGVLVYESDRAKSPVRRHFVIYHPTSAARCEAILQREQDGRTVRALTEGQGYTFVLDKDGGRPFYWCLSASGEVYETTRESCACPDYEYRCRLAGVHCKHIVALNAGVGRVITW